MTRKACKSKARSRGAAIVEMVLVTPILLFLMLATAEVSNLLVDHNTLTKAVRNGARYVASHENAYRGSTGVVVLGAAVLAETRNLIVYGNTAGTGTPVLPGLAPANITITDTGGNNIQVTASHPVTGILGALLPNLVGGSDISLVHNLQATVTMRAL